MIRLVDPEKDELIRQMNHSPSMEIALSAFKKVVPKDQWENEEKYSKTTGKPLNDYMKKYGKTPNQVLEMLSDLSSGSVNILRGRSKEDKAAAKLEIEAYKRLAELHKIKILNKNNINIVELSIA
jgi:hypothetical protein